MCFCGNCRIFAVLASVVIGVIAAFMQITGMITVTAAFLWVTLGVAVGFMALFVLTASHGRGCCGALGVPLAGVLGTALLSVVLLAVGVTATSVVSAILVGALLSFFSLILAGSACYVRCVADCDE